MAFIIGEVGSNHNCNFKQAIVLIDVAVAAKCDAVKFQTFSSETLYASSTPDFAGYKNINKLIKDIELPRHWQKDLKMYCDDHGIEFMSTPFDERAVDELVELGVKRLKIAGFESTDPRFVKLCASTKLPLIISIGIGANDNSLNEIYNLIYADHNDYDLTFLHCNNAYPTPFIDINLKSIQLMRILINDNGYYNIGLSDHTPGILVPPVAVGMGAQCIEKHFTISKLLPGPDHHFAIEPQELKDMVTNIRTVETCLGYKEGLFTESEKDFKMGTRSVVTKCKINMGVKLTEDNITTKRPHRSGDIPASLFYHLIDNEMAVNSNLQEDTIVKHIDLKEIINV